MRVRFLAAVGLLVVSAGCGGGGGGATTSPASGGAGGSSPVAAGAQQSPLNEVPLKSSFDLKLTYDGQNYNYGPFEEIGSSQSKFLADPGGFSLLGEYKSSDGEIDLSFDFSSDKDMPVGKVKVSSYLVLLLVGWFLPGDHASVRAANGECTIQFTAYSRTTGLKGSIDCRDLVADNGKHLSYTGNFSGTVR